jgi:hypothetical protein
VVSDEEKGTGMTKQLKSVAYMFLISFFFASLVSAVKYLSEETIESGPKAAEDRPEGFGYPDGEKYIQR